MCIFFSGRTYNHYDPHGHGHSHGHHKIPEYNHYQQPRPPPHGLSPHPEPPPHSPFGHPGPRRCGAPSSLGVCPINLSCFGGADGKYHYLCERDRDCALDHKCCPDTEGHCICQKIRNIMRYPGCPAPDTVECIVKGTGGYGHRVCNSDRECAPNMICCSDKYAHRICIPGTSLAHPEPPIHGRKLFPHPEPPPLHGRFPHPEPPPLDGPFPHPEPPPPHSPFPHPGPAMCGRSLRHGVCPISLSCFGGANGLYHHICSDDDHCDIDHKCCPDTGGHCICQKIRNIRRYPGCPAPDTVACIVKGPGGHGHNICNTDRECAPNMICCSDKFGHRICIPGRSAGRCPISRKKCWKPKQQRRLARTMRRCRKCTGPHKKCCQIGCKFVCRRV